MINVIYIGIGGFIGAVLRYLISRYLNQLIPSFPVGTFIVNMTGSFILGFLMYAFISGRSISGSMRDFITIGILGGFTTMSSFAYESFRLLELNEFSLFALNVLLNFILCIAAVYFGKQLAFILVK
jgi:CrcB protein